MSKLPETAHEFSLRFRPQVRVLPGGWIAYKNDDGTPVYREMTPTEHKRRRKTTREVFRTMRAELQIYREKLAAAQSDWDRERAEMHITEVWNLHINLQRELYLLRTITVRK